MRRSIEVEKKKMHYSNKARRHSPSQQGHKLNTQRSTSSVKPSAMIMTPPPRTVGKRSVTNSNESHKSSSSSSLPTSRLPSKQDFLSRFQDQEEDGIFSTPQSNNHELPRDDSLSDSAEVEDILSNENLGDAFFLDNEFQTLKLSPKRNGRGAEEDPFKSQNQNNVETLKLQSAKSRASLSPNQDLLKYVESPEHVDSFDDEFLDLNDMGFKPNDERVSNKLKFRQPMILLREVRLSPSPTTLSTSSPKRRKSLSEYSEDTCDTDITSQFNENDFEDIDNIFGEGETGIYSGNGNETQDKSMVFKANQHLSMMQKKLQNDAEIEERELQKKYRKLHEHNEAKTLRSRDFTNRRDDENENEKTLRYDANEEFNEFENDFDLESPIKVEKLKQFKSNKKSDNTDHPLITKMSMPNFQSSTNSNSMKKYRSTVDLVRELENEHPVFNNNNKIIRKLDRIPSFYNKNNSSNEKDARMNQDIELQKQQLLNKYMEISEKQKRLNGKQNQQNRNSQRNESPTSPRLKLNSSQKNNSRNKKRIGLVRYSNNEALPQSTIQNSKMKFNPTDARWEGNDIDLLRFENIAPSTNSLNKSQSNRLINAQDFDQKTHKIHGNMVFDSENLRWINLDADDGDDVFNDILNLNSNQEPELNRSISFKRSGSTKRGFSHSNQRANSTSSLASSEIPRSEIDDVENDSDEVSNDTETELFNISDKTIEKFLKEEQKIIKKTKYWFHNNATYNLNSRSNFSPEYFWEIRKMVIDGDED